MSQASAKAIAPLLVSILSFLGWSPSDYAGYLPKEIKSQIVLELPIAETTSTSPAPKTVVPTKSSTKKSVPAKIVKPIVKKSIPTQATKPVVPLTTKIITPPTSTPFPTGTVHLFDQVQSEKVLHSGPSPSSPLILSGEGNANAASPSPYGGKSQGEVNQNLSPEEKINKSTVNILCSMQRGNTIAKYTGSGVVIDPSGVIITNAHVAEHVLLAEAGYESCNIRTGSPAHNSYKAKVIYLPDSWINANKNNLQMQTLSGTGENDYALLIITERTSQNAPNVPLAYLVPSDKSVSSGDAITLAGYPAGFGDASLLDSALYLLQKPSQISKTFSLNGGSSDVIDTSATSLAVHGSSGGAMVGSGGDLIGIIDSTIVDNFSGQAAIQGISISYIKNSIQNNLGKGLQSLIDNAQTEANNFASTKVQSLSSILMQ